MAMDSPISLKGKLVWIGLILLVAVWMFVLGILVGRGTAPMPLMTQSIENKLAQLQSAPSDNGQTNPESPSEQDNNIPVTELKFYEELKETESIRRPIKVPPKPATPTKSDQLPRQSDSAKTPSPKPTPQKSAPVTKKAVTQPGQGAPPSAATSPSPSSERFTIQVAAVKNAQNAEKLVLDLRSKGFDAYQISSQSQDGDTLYRIRVGAFQDRSEAQATLSRLSKVQINGMVLRTP